MPETDFKIFDTEMLTQLMNDQFRVPQLFSKDNTANKEAIEIEQRSADFVVGFATGDIIVTEKARSLLPDYFALLKHSSHPQVTAYLERAQNKFETIPVLNKSQPERELNVSLDRESLIASHFSVLESKKRAGLLTSSDLLFIADVLNEDLGYSTERLKSKVQSYAQIKISKVLKGEFEPDESFDKLLLLYGNGAHLGDTNLNSQQEPIANESLNIMADADEPAVESNLDYEALPTTDTTLGEVDSISVTEEPVVDVEPEPIVIPEPETIVIPELEPVSLDETPAPAIELPPLVEEKKPSIQSIRDSILKRKQHLQALTANNFAILDNKKKMATLSSDDFLALDAALSLKLEETKKNTKPYHVLMRQKAILTSFAQNKIQSTLEGKNKRDDNFEDLVTTLGSFQQQKTFRERGCLPFVDDMEFENPIVVTVDEKTEAKMKKEKEKKEKEEKRKSETEKKKERKAATTPWYKKLWDKGKRVAVIVGVAAISLFGLAKFAQHSSSPDNSDNAPQTEQKTQTVTTPVNDAKTINYENAKKQTPVQAQADTKAQVKTETTAENPTQFKAEVKAETKAEVKAETKAETQLSKEDQGYAKRTAGFVKKIAKMHQMSEEDVKTTLDNFVNSMDLPSGVSSHRMAYLVGFYALFPNSEFGHKINKMFNGDEVSVSKEDVAKLSKEHGKHGKKNLKDMKTLQIMQAKAHVK